MAYWPGPVESGRRGWEGKGSTTSPRNELGTEDARYNTLSKGSPSYHYIVRR